VDVPLLLCTWLELNQSPVPAPLMWIALIIIIFPILSFVARPVLSSKCPHGMQNQSKSWILFVPCILNRIVQCRTNIK
jgi:hypothetical protein